MYLVLFLAVGALVFLGSYQYITGQSRYGNTGEKLSIADLKDKVNDYINDDTLEIADIFVYNDSDYYFSIEEKATGRGAFELLVNPFRGSIHPEQGPNMMWNDKYQMHQYMGRYDNKLNISEISRESAIDTANQFVKDELDTLYNVNGTVHHFYGYYTFHIFDESDETIGMLSVNSYTSQVWIHTWHGKISEIISHHE